MPKEIISFDYYWPNILFLLQVHSKKMQYKIEVEVAMAYYV